MSCPTCDHTMQNLGVDNQRIFWCPKCGTLKTESGDHSEVEQTIWTKRLIESARLAYPHMHVAQKSTVGADWPVTQRDMSSPLLGEIEIRRFR